MEAQLLTYEDIDTILSENIDEMDKIMSFGGYLWNIIDRPFLERWLGELDATPYKIIHNDEIIGFVAVWVNRSDPFDSTGYTKISNGYIFKSHRSERFEGKSYAQWMVQLGYEKAKELYPEKKVMAKLYDCSYSRFPVGHKFAPRPFNIINSVQSVGFTVHSEIDKQRNGYRLLYITKD